VFTLNNYELQVGTPQGLTTPFIVTIQFSGSEVVNGQTTNESFTYQLVSLTLA